MKKIAPSILSADFANLEKEIKAVAQAGADLIHVDVMDGHFVPNLTIGIPVVESLKKISPIPLDVHLMIEKPEKYVDAFLKAGSDYLTIHVESTDQAEALLKKIRTKAKSGITLRPRTSILTIEPFLKYADLVLVMTVEPGFGGQSFMQDQVEKIKWLADYRQKHQLQFQIEVDGGVNLETRKYLDLADILVAGSYIFKNDYHKAINSLR
jgi:ribulose-phosphate 3-epimerase